MLLPTSQTVSWELPWRRAEMVMKAAGLAPVVRTWIVLYGPEVRR